MIRSEIKPHTVFHLNHFWVSGHMLTSHVTSELMSQKSYIKMLLQIIIKSHKSISSKWYFLNNII